MKDAIGKAISLGLGLVIAGKEQIEKTVEDLVKKGEVSRAESKSLIDDLVKKGEEAQQKIEASVKERINAALRDSRLATKEDIARIEQRLQALEQKIGSDD